MESLSAPQLNYRKAIYNHPSYRYNKVLMQTGGNSITFSQAGGSEYIFEIPVSTFNLSKSYFTMQVRLPTGPNPGYNWLYQNTCPFFRQIQLYTRGGQYICDLNEAANYLKIVVNAETKLEEFLTFPMNEYAQNVALGAAQATPGLIGAGSFFQRNNSTLANYQGGDARPGMGVVGSTMAYTEPKYVLRSTVEAGGNESVMVVNFRIPLGLIKNTIFELDKDLYFGEVILLRLVTHAYTKIFYTGTNAANPDTGNNAAAAAPTSADVALYVAVEKDLNIVNQLMNQMQTSGIQLVIPYVWYSKFNPGGATTSQNVSIRYNRGQGVRLRKIYHSVFHNTESSNTAYDHNNVNGAKVVEYYTLLNNNRLQEFNVDCTHLDDYSLVKDKIEGSVLQEADIYQYNWFHLEDFTGIYEIDPEDKNNIIVGLPLETEQKWDFYSRTANAQYNHYTYAIVERNLSISPAGVVVS